MTSEEQLEESEGFDEFIDGWLGSRIPANPLAEYRNSGGRPVWIIAGEIYHEISSEEFLEIIDAHDDDRPGSEHSG